MIGDLLVGTGAGAVAGAVFFGGLHWTVSRLSETRWPAILVVVSLLVRSAVVVGLFLLMANGGLARLLGGLGGLLAVRTGMVWTVRRADTARGWSSWT